MLEDKKIVQLGVEYGLILRFEAFADRGYTSAGHLMSRDKAGALLSREQARNKHSQSHKAPCAARAVGNCHYGRTHYACMVTRPRLSRLFARFEAL